MRTMAARRGFLGLLVATALFGSGLVCVAHAADGRAIGWILTRVGSAARPIEGTLVASAVSDESAVLMFATTGPRAHRRVDYNFVTTTAEWGGSGWVYVNDSRVPAVPCVAACESPVGFQRTVYVTSNDRSLSSTVYVTAYDVKDATLTITTPGWAVRRWEPGWHDLTTANAAGSSTVTVDHESAGTYHGGQLSGGRYGSIASAFLPCDFYGEGNATMTGGGRVQRMSCASSSVALDASPTRTTWRVTGEATGVSSATGVLIVVDFPR
jgi:hypothetical protein